MSSTLTHSLNIAAHEEDVSIGEEIATLGGLIALHGEHQGSVTAMKAALAKRRRARLAERAHNTPEPH